MQQMHTVGLEMTSTYHIQLTQENVRRANRALQPGSEDDVDIIAPGKEESARMLHLPVPLRG